MKISEVVRGEDLLVSSARQCLIFDAIGWARQNFYNCKLFFEAEVKKLSKSKRCCRVYLKLLKIARAFAAERNSYWA